MSVHDSIIAAVVTTLDEVGCGIVHTRRRYFDSSEQFEAQCSAGPEGAKILQAAMISLGGIGREEERIVRSGGAYDSKRTRSYKILVLRGLSDAVDSENAIARLTESIIEHFDTATVRERFEAIGITLHSAQAPLIGQGMWFDTLVSQAEITLDTVEAL